MTEVAALDVGGTTVKVALVTSRGVPREVTRVPTPVGDPTGRRLVDLILHVVGELSSRTEVVGVGVALPGIVDTAAERAVYSANLGWSDLPFGAILRNRIDLPLAIGHDIRAGALAEARVGALRDVGGRGLFAAVGTGVSIALVENGEMLPGAPWQGEIGQIRVPDPASPGRVALESFASAQGIARACGVADSERAAALVRDGDIRAGKAWDAGVAALGDALAWCATAFGAEHLVVGGGLAQAGDRFFDPLTAALAERMSSKRRPDVRPAALGGLAGCIGAGLLAHDAILGNHR